VAQQPSARPALRGGALALPAAVLFGVSTPRVPQFGLGLGAFSTAALRYAGAAAVGLLSRQRIEREARLQLGDRSASGLMVLGSLLMLAGVVLHLAEFHGHEHAALEHEHAHRHDDGHHTHTHDPMPAGAHSHRHRHEPLGHAHPHVPDMHHAHRH